MSKYTTAELYNALADLQGETAELSFHVKGCLFPIAMPESARDELASQLKQAVKLLDSARALAYRIDSGNYKA